MGEARDSSVERVPERPLSIPRGRASGGGSLAQFASAMGNAAFARAVSVRPTVGASSVPLVARYEGGEHAQFGGTEKVIVNGVEMPAGNVIAMADF